MSATFNKVWLGLGGNVGDVASHMQAALTNVHAHPEIRVIAVSSIYKTPPWGNVDQAWFLNACAEIETSLDPENLLDVLLETERQLQRERNERWGPRTIDLDILIYGDQSLESGRLTIPHPRMHERAFVLKPLLELTGPVELAGKTIEDWLALQDDSEIELHCDRGWFEVAD